MITRIYITYLAFTLKTMQNFAKVIIKGLLYVLAFHLVFLRDIYCRMHVLRYAHP